MIVVIPPPLATDYGYDAKTYVSNATLHALVHFILLQIAMRFVKDQCTKISSYVQVMSHIFIERWDVCWQFFAG